MPPQKTDKDNGPQFQNLLSYTLNKLAIYKQVSIVTRASIPGTDKYFSLHHSIQTDRQTVAAPYWMAIGGWAAGGGYCPAGKVEVWQSDLCVTSRRVQVGTTNKLKMSMRPLEIFKISKRADQPARTRATT